MDAAEGYPCSRRRPLQRQRVNGEPQGSCVTGSQLAIQSAPCRSKGLSVQLHLLIHRAVPSFLTTITAAPLYYTLIHLSVFGSYVCVEMRPAVFIII